MGHFTSNCKLMSALDFMNPEHSRDTKQQGSVVCTVFKVILPQKEPLHSHLKKELQYFFQRHSVLLCKMDKCYSSEVISQDFSGLGEKPRASEK